MRAGKKVHKSRQQKVEGKAEQHHVIVAFEGFNNPFTEDGGQEVPADEAVVVNDILQSVKQGIDGVGQTHIHTIALSTDIDENAKFQGKKFIDDNMRVVGGRQRGKLIIYGYSLGGDTAVELADDIQQLFHVDLLITVDGTTPGNVGVDREIPANVRRNVNFWTDAPAGTFGQQGGPNTAIDKNLTQVQNVLRSDDLHSNIDERTAPKVKEIIRAELKVRRTSRLVEPIVLSFDGKKLIVKGKVGNQIIEEFPSASSGLPPRARRLKELIDEGRTDLTIDTDYRDPKHQGVKDAGPIPEETYDLKLSQTMPFEKKGGGFGIGGWRLESGTWGDFTVIAFGARGGFFLHHDGGQPGTSGCIGLRSVAEFKKLKQILIEAAKLRQEVAQVHVSYGVIADAAKPRRRGRTR